MGQAPNATCCQGRSRTIAWPSVALGDSAGREVLALCHSCGAAVAGTLMWGVPGAGCGMSVGIGQV